MVRTCHNVVLSCSTPPPRSLLALQIKVLLTACHAHRKRSLAGRPWPNWKSCGSLPNNGRGHLSPDSRLETPGSRQRQAEVIARRATSTRGNAPGDAEFLSGAAGAARPEAADYCGGQKSLALSGTHPG